jgi:leucyl aminopeptidase (aminopeptidase T)
MSWPQKESIVPSVVEMLRMNMGLQSGERLLVVTDVPRTRDWQAARQAELEEMLERAMLARLVSAIAAQHFPDCSVNFLPFSATGLHGTEPDETAAARMREADVVIALTTYSLSHTNGRQAVTEAGGRLASMAGFEARMFEAGGPMAVDHQKLASDCQALADRLTAASEVIVRTPYGTDLRFSMKG